MLPAMPRAEGPLRNGGARCRSVARRTALAVLLAWVVAPWGPGGGLHAQSPNFMTGFGETPAITSASPQRPEALNEVTFQQRLGQPLPLDATFRDERGETVALGQYFGGEKPVILAFVYYTCPMLCTQIMNGVSATLRGLTFEAGRDFEVVLVSFDPRDTPEAAAQKKRDHLAYWKAEATASGWHLLTGDSATIRRVADAAGFNYRWDEQTQQFAHVSGVLVVTPEGLLSRYFYGIEYSPRELRLALVESGQGHIGSLVDEVLLYCFQYDPLSGTYGLMIRNLLRAGGVLTLAFILGAILLMRRRETRVHAEGRA